MEKMTFFRFILTGVVMTPLVGFFSATAGYVIYKVLAATFIAGTLVLGFDVDITNGGPSETVGTILLSICALIGVIICWSTLWEEYKNDNQFSE